MRTPEVDMFQKIQGLFWLLTLLMVGGCSNEVATKAGSDLPSAAEAPVIAQESRPTITKPIVANRVQR
jgi:hypothetical protein